MYDEKRKYMDFIIEKNIKSKTYYVSQQILEILKAVEMYGFCQESVKNTMKHLLSKCLLRIQRI